MNKINELLRELGEEIETHILQGDFKLVDLNEFKARVSIKDSNDITFWMANGDASFRICTENLLDNFSFKTEIDKLNGYGIVMKDHLREKEMTKAQAEKYFNCKITD